MKKILVRAPQWLGDAVVSTVFLTRLKTQRPGDSISVLCVPALVSLYENHPAVNQVIPLPYPDGTVFSVGKILRNEGFDEAYVLPRSFRAALEVYLGKIPRRIGYAGDLRRFLLTDVFSYTENRRYAHRYLAIIGEESISLESLKAVFPASQPINDKFLSLKKPLLGLAPVSIAPSRTWAAERFADAANRWQEKNGGTVVLFGSKREREQVQTVANGIKGPNLNTAGDLSLPELGWMIKNCDLFMGNDSGLMHVAGAFQIPGVIVFGASDPGNALPPWGKLVSVQHKEIFCVPCLRNHCARFGSGHNECLKAVTSVEVVEIAAGTSVAGRSSP